MMKILTVLFTVFLISAAISSCDSDLSIEDKINDAKPIKYITIWRTSSFDSFWKENGDFTDAYAKDGYLVVKINQTEKRYFNLDDATEIDIAKYDIELYYR